MRRGIVSQEALGSRPPGFDPRICNVPGCGRPLRDHAVGEFCRRPDLPPSGYKPTPIDKEFHIMSKTATWVDQAAKDLGIANEQPCGHCKGKGKIRRAPTKGAISGALGYSQTGAKTLAKSLTDPPLSRLRTVADALGGVSLDDAAAWCAQLAKRIEAEG